MATPVIQSSNTQTGQNVSSLVITKPTGLAEGDLLVAALAMHDANDNNRTFSTPSGWTLATNSTTGASAYLVRTVIFYKEADSSDVAASDFTFTIAASSVYVAVGYLARIDGHVPVSPITVSESDSDNTLSASPSFTTALTPDIPENSLLFFVIASSDSDVGTETVSGYASTPSATWTEQADVAVVQSNDGVVMGVATAPYDSTTEITARTATFSASNTYHASSIAVIRGSYDDGTTIPFVASTQSAFAPTGRADANGVASFVASTQSKFDPTGKGTAPTEWTNESEESTTWTNEASL